MLTTDTLTIHFNAYDLLESADLGPLHTEDAHETRLRADNGNDEDEVDLRAIESDQYELAEAYEEALVWAVRMTADTLGVRVKIRNDLHTTIATRTNNTPAEVTLEDAILAIAMHRVQAVWHIPEGHTSGGWAVFRDSELRFEL